MYRETTSNITVAVSPIFLEDQSDPERNHYVWAYRVEITNHGTEPVQLRGRYWHITDSRGRVHEIEGEGVIGEQPILQPGETYEYSSGTPLAAPSGIMHGRYRMTDPDGQAFQVDIPAFSLDSPHDEATAH